MYISFLRKSFFYSLFIASLVCPPSAWAPPKAGIGQPEEGGKESARAPAKQVQANNALSLSLQPDDQASKDKGNENQRVSVVSKPALLKQDKTHMTAVFSWFNPAEFGRLLGASKATGNLCREVTANNNVMTKHLERTAFRCGLVVKDISFNKLMNMATARYYIEQPERLNGRILGRLYGKWEQEGFLLGRFLFAGPFEFPIAEPHVILQQYADSPTVQGYQAFAKAAEAGSVDACFLRVMVCNNTRGTLLKKWLSMSLDPTQNHMEGENQAIIRRIFEDTYTLAKEEGNISHMANLETPMPTLSGDDILRLFDLFQEDLTPSNKSHIRRGNFLVNGEVIFDNLLTVIESRCLQVSDVEGHFLQESNLDLLGSAAAILYKALDEKKPVRVKLLIRLLLIYMRLFKQHFDVETERNRELRNNIIIKIKKAHALAKKEIESQWETLPARDIQDAVLPLYAPAVPITCDQEELEYLRERARLLDNLLQKLGDAAVAYEYIRVVRAHEQVAEKLQDGEEKEGHLKRAAELREQKDKLFQTKSESAQ